MRYQFYREHKYVSSALNDVERLIAKTDFRKPTDTDKAEQEFQTAIAMLKTHAHYEDSRLHPLLKNKGSHLFQEAESDHQHHDEQFQHLQSLLDAIKASYNDETRIDLGYQFYLTFRKFVGDNLLHLHHEETTILPELQRLYTDSELRAVELDTYHLMTPDEIVDMLQILFPHMNSLDQEAFIHDLQAAVPEKLALAWARIQPLFISYEPNVSDL